MSVSEWLDDTDESLGEIDGEIEGATKRASEGRGGVRNTFKREKISDDKNKKTIFRLLTARSGERFKHWLWLPNGKKVGMNCAANKDQQDNSIKRCPFCQYVATGGGASGESRAQLNHEYMFIALVGTVQKVYKEIDGKDVATDKVIWTPEPQCVLATPPMARQFYQWYKNTEFPEGADGKITSYNFQAYKYYKSGGSQAKDIRYSIDYYDSSPRPTEALDENNESVTIDLSIANVIRDQIAHECQPNDPDVLRAMLEEARGQGVVIAQEGNTPAETAAEPPKDAAGSLSDEHDFEDDEEIPKSAQPGETF